MIDPRNYIPGCVSYTKASEISSLQKYLKKGIKKRDEALELPKTPDELNKDPRIPGVTELPKGAVSLHDPREVTELPDKSLKITNPNGITLENRREDLEGTQEISELPETRLDINEALTPDLPGEAVKAPGEITEPESLEDTRIDLGGEVHEVESLTETKIEAPSSETQDEVLGLPDTVIEGPELKDVTLENHRENIKTNKDISSLETHREGLDDQRGISLEDHQESLEDKRNISLENHQEELSDKRDVALDDHREDLEDKRNLKLSGHLESLEDRRGVSLEDHQEELSDKRNTVLDDSREDLEDNRSVSLRTDREELSDKRVVSLEDTQLKTPGKQETPELSGTIISGPEVKDVGLEKSKKTISDSRNVQLSNHREDLSGVQDPELPETVVGLSDKRSISLETSKEKLEDRRSTELSSHRESISVPGTPDLSTTSVGLKATSEVALEDHRERLGNVQEISGLSEEQTELPGKPKDVSLQSDTQGLPGTRKEPGIETTKIARPGQDKDVVLPVDINKLEGTADLDSLDTTRLDITDDTEVSLPGDALPIEGGDTTDISSLETTVIGRPGETPDLDQIYGDASGKELYPLKGLDVTLPDTRIDISDDREPFLEDTVIPGESDASDPGWSGELEDTIIQGTPDMSDPGWNGSLEDTVISDSGDQNPEGWGGALEDERLGIGAAEVPDLVTIPKIKSEPEDNWTAGNDQNEKGWDGELVSVDDIKEEPEDNWTIEPNLNPKKPADINDILGLKVKVGIMPHITEASADPDHAQKFVDISQNHSFDKESDEYKVSSSITSEFTDGSISSLKKYGEETKVPKLRPDHENPKHTDNPGWKHIDTPSMSQEDFKEYNKKVKITGHVVEKSADPDHRQRNKLIDLSQNHSFDQKNDPTDGVSSSIVSEFYGTTELEKYGKETEKPKLRPDHENPKETNDPNWKHTDVHGMNQNKFDEYTGNYVKMRTSSRETSMDPDHAQNFIDISQNHSFDKESDDDKVSSSITSEFTEKSISSLEEYGKKTKDPIEVAQYKPAETPLDPSRRQKLVDTTIDLSFDKKDSDGSVINAKEYGENTREPLKLDEDPRQSYIGSESYKEAALYKESIETVVKMPSLTKKTEEEDHEALGKAFEWSDNNMRHYGDVLAIPAYKLGVSFTSYLNPSKYLRWTVEKQVGILRHSSLRRGSAKQWILDEALAGLIAARDLLEKTLKLQPWRLPGSNEYAIQLLRQGMSGIDIRDAKNFVQNTAANLLSSSKVIIKNPINRPEKEDKLTYLLEGESVERKYSWEAMKKFETKDGKNKADNNTEEDIAGSNGVKIFGSNQGLKEYSPVYLNKDIKNKEDLGLFGTIRNLTTSNIEKINSFSDLKQAIESSPWITSSSKLIGNRYGDHRHDVALTLDSNHVWEIIFEPYIGVENGDCSFLPSIHQINYENYKNFGLSTNWDTWIPFTSFELNSKKMVQKNIGLYSGEISIPQNLEFTNELRLVICDDQYKSWKRYFDYVMHASTFYCKPHDATYYAKDFLIGDKRIQTFEDTDIAKYQKGVIQPAPYKNLAFRCRIFSMNPQYQTINKSDLLVVLKDFTEEWQGEVDSSPTELSLMFSVVGENPKGYRKNHKYYSPVDSGKNGIDYVPQTPPKADGTSIGDNNDGVSTA